MAEQESAAERSPASPRSRWGWASVRVRVTVAAVLVVAVALLVGALALVTWVRGSLHEGAEATAEQRAEGLAAQIEAAGSVTAVAGRGVPPDERDQDADDLVWQVTDQRGVVVAASSRLSRQLPRNDIDELRLDGEPFVVATEAARTDSGRYVVSVAVELEEVQESTEALTGPLLVGLPLVLLLVGAITWVSATRALTSVERIRQEVEQITGDRLDRRVPVPPSRDEISRLARTMNEMLARLEAYRSRQQQFVSDASHELRSPIASIRQTAEVEVTHPGAMQPTELAETVLEEAARMQRLVEQLLLLTRADEGAAPTKREVDVDDLAIAEAGRVRREGLTLDTSGVQPGRVHGDEVALGQVVRNLVENAARHAATTVSVQVAQRDGVVELAVDDDGAGVPEGDRDRIFHRFVRLDEARAREVGGSGLGLAIVREIVRAHRGSVSVGDSVLGGARFVVRLPAAGDAA